MLKNGHETGSQKSFCLLKKKPAIWGDDKLKDGHWGFGLHGCSNLDVGQLSGQLKFVEFVECWYMLVHGNHQGHVDCEVFSWHL